MDGLIILLIIIGAISRLSKKDKKKKDAAASTPGKRNADSRIPFAPAEWEQYLKGLNIPTPDKKAAKRKVSAAKAAAKTAQPSAAAAKRAASQFAKKAAPAAQPVFYLAHDEPEGTVSTQGESAAEHAVHRSRILAEEAQLEQEQEILRELRSANLQKLRSAVVMSEVLGKPVALRGRRW